MTVTSNTIVVAANKSGTGGLRRRALGDFRIGKPRDARRSAVAH
jgi:hypothetical protein